jgi:hypothetical protein
MSEASVINAVILAIAFAFMMVITKKQGKSENKKA